MAPPTAVHTILTSNLARHLGNALDGRAPCTVRSEAGIIDANGTSWYQADLAVTCQPHRPGQIEVGEHWQHEILVDASEVLRLETVGLAIEVGRVYANIELEVSIAGA